MISSIDSIDAFFSIRHPFSSITVGLEAKAIAHLPSAQYLAHWRQRRRESRRLKFDGG